MIKTFSFKVTIDTEDIIEKYDLNDEEDNNRLDYETFEDIIFDAVTDYLEETPMYHYFEEQDIDTMIKTIIKEVNFNKKPIDK